MKVMEVILFKYKFLFLTVLFLLSISIVYAGDNSTIYNPSVINESRVDISNDTVTALEDGHYNTSFSDGSRGYCLEYGELEAIEGDSFYKVATDYYTCSNYLKVYFTQYTSHALSDKVVCQHMIWHFSDGFDGWRLNYTIIDEVKSSDLIIPDYYVQRLNATHERVWSFNVLLSPYEHHQDYFTYSFFDRSILDDLNVTNSSIVENTTNITDVNCNNTNLLINNTFNIYERHNFNESIKEERGNATKSQLNSIITGQNLYNTVLLLVFGLLLISGIYLIQKKYYK